MLSKHNVLLHTEGRRKYYSSASTICVKMARANEPWNQRETMFRSWSDLPTLAT